MKRSEKLLDAIGQIDDRLVEEAARAGREEEEARNAGQEAARAGGKDEAALKPGQEAPKTEKKEKAIKAGKAEMPGGKRRRKPALYRWQGALAACAVVAVCAGVFGVLQREGILFGPYEGSTSGAPEMALEGLEMEEAGQEDNVAADTAAVTAEPDALSAAAPDAGEAAGQSVVGAAADEAAGQSAGEGAGEASGQSADGAAAGGAAAGEPSAQSAKDTAGAASEQGTVKDRSAAQEAYAQPRDSEEMAAAENPDQEEETKKNGSGQSASAGGAADAVVTVTACSAESVTFLLENRGNENLCYGARYELERLTDGSWQTVQPVKEPAWEDSLYMIAPGGSGEITENFNVVYGSLPEGRYRLVKEYWAESAEEGQETAKYSAYAEFTVEE